MSPKRLFVFDQYRLDEQERQLVRKIQAIALPPKVFDSIGCACPERGSFA